MMDSRRSASVGALPREKKHFVSRTESSSGASLDVRCACQFFESDSLLPERINPVESRPSSKLGFHGEYGSENEHFERLTNDRMMDSFHPMNLETSMHVDNVSNRSFNVAGHHHEVDRLSMRSIGAQRSWEKPTVPPIDLAFVEKYPELEETARSRGLIVRSISDATEGDAHGSPPTSGTFMAGHRRRQLSVGGISGMRDPETMSVRSVTSVRRISRSPSKTDLFVADINIPQANRRDQRSASASRRTSNVDLSHFPSRRISNVDLTNFSPHQATPTPLFVEPILPQQQQTLTTPQVNLIAPTPSPAIGDTRPDFSKALTPLRSTSPPAALQDYRIAKPPLSTDYMRPDSSNEPGYHAPGSDILPQHRPIDMSKYNDSNEPTVKSNEKTLNSEITFKASAGQIALASKDALQPLVSSKIKTSSTTGSRAASPAPLDPLEQTVAVLEEIAATHNVLDIYDNIKSESYRPPSITGDIPLLPPSVGEETRIDIKTILPVVDIDELVRSEREKAAAEQNKPKPAPRHKSPPSRRPKSPPPPPQNTQTAQMDTLQLPGLRSNAHTQSQTQLKRQHTPERDFSPDGSKRSMRQSPLPEPQPIEMHTLTLNGAIPLQEASLEAKSTYASRFKTMFSPKNNSTSKEKSPRRQPSPSPIREKSASPVMGRSTSSPSKLMTIFTKNIPEVIQIMPKSSPAVPRKSVAEPMSVKVTETFSLKVDEMDQYISRPAKPPTPPISSPVSSSIIGHSATPVHSVYSSRENFSSFDRASADISEPFTPIIIPTANRAQFLAGNRTLYSSEIDTQPRRSESELRHVGGSRTPSIGPSVQHMKGQLISVPINIGGSGEVAHLPPAIGGSSQRLSGYSRTPSEQRMQQSKLGRKPSFMEGRTQSHDRARITGSHEDLYAGSRMTKTVSFNFGERKSRLSEFENVSLSQQQKDQRDFLERTYFSRDHEYEPIGEAPAPEGQPSIAKEPSPSPFQAQVPNQDSMEVSTSRDNLKAAEDMQRDMEERFFSSATTTPRTEARNNNEVHKSQVDSSALEELALRPDNRKKGFMASAQDRTRKMQAGIKTQAGKIKTKLRTPAKKSPSSSPKIKERKRFKAPEFSKIKMPEIKRPDMSKLKDFKRPEFTKFNKPDMSKFKLPEKFSTLKLRRSKSFKENENVPEDDDMTGVVAEPSGATTADAVPQHKKMFEFNFGTYPRAFRKKKKPVEPEPSFDTGTGTEGPSIITSTGTQPSMESSSSPQGDRGPGPVRSRWADKFSDVSYNDSEGSRYRRYGSEQESFDRESSLERRMREDLEDAASEEAATNLGILGGVADQKQFAEFDEENRAIHEISNLRAGEFKRRPMVHQDSDLISEEGKEPVGWTDKEVQKNKLLRKAELEAEASYLHHPSDDTTTQETQSTASSGKKVVMEEIDDDEFFLRKRGVSEDNSELRQYISTAIREGFDMPVNTLQHVGRPSESMEYGDYDVPPPKPRRLHKTYRPEDVSQEFEMQRNEYDDDNMSLSQNGSDFLGAPKRPMRKGHSRSKYSMDSQDIPIVDQHHEQYFDDDEEYLRPPPRMFAKGGHREEKLNDLNIIKKEATPEVEDSPMAMARPQAPRRRKRQQRDLSAEKEAYINGFGGRSVSNSFLQPTEDVTVYRTEHEYHMPLATPEHFTDGTSAASRKSRSLSRYDDDRTSRGADSIAMDNILRNELETKDPHPLNETDAQEKFIIDMMENDGYAIVRKEHMPKPTPPARRKKFSRSPGERFATMPNMRSKRDSPVPPERPPPPRGYSPATLQPIPPRRKSALSLDEPQNIEDDYEEPEAMDFERPESPRDLQSGDIINKMKYRPLPPPPRPPREKKQRGASGKGFLQDDGQDEQESNFDDRDGGGERIATSSTAESYDQNDEFEDDPHFVEVEVSTQTDPLPEDFICEEFEITQDMKVIEPRRSVGKTLEDLLKEEQEELERNRPLSEDEQLAMGLQKFRDANQRSLSEKSRASSQADRSKSQSRPQTPSAVIIERRVSTPIPHRDAKESMLEAALIVRPIDDLDLEEEELRREGLLTDGSQQSKSDVEEEQILSSDYSHGPSSIELEEAIESLRSQIESERETEDDMEVELTMQEHPVEYYKHEETHLTLAHHNIQNDEEEEKEEEKEEEEKEEEQEVEEEKEAEEEKEKEEEERETFTMTDMEYKKELSKEGTPPSDYEVKHIGYLKEEEISDDINKYEYESNISKEELEDEDEGEVEIDSEVEMTQLLKPIQVSEMPQTVADLQQSDTEKESELPKLTELQRSEEPPQAPPRRRSTTIIEQPATLAIVEHEPIQEIVPQQSVAEQSTQPTHMAIADLEVERLRVHALQAGQIMVSQLHGTQISSEELDCKSGNLVVKNIELPPGFIEDIVERVRISERSQVQAAETQTSLQNSQELLAREESPTAKKEMVPPPKPPRQKDLEQSSAASREIVPDPPLFRLRSPEEDTTTQSTQTMETTTTSSSSPLPPVFPTVEYLQSLAPLAFYNLRNIEQNELTQRRRRHRRRSQDSSEDDEPADGATEHYEQPAETDEPPVERRSHRTRSGTRPSSETELSVAQAGRKFLSACSLSLVNIINQLTDCVRDVTNKEIDSETRSRQVPTLVVLFILITFGVLLFLLSGKSVHHHHWDYFNPPGNDGRLS